MTPAVIERFATALQQELDADRIASGSERAGLQAQLDEVRSRIARLARRLEEDEDAPRTLVERLKELESQEFDLVGALTEVPEQTVVQLPSNYEPIYRRAVAELEQHLASTDGQAAKEAVRALIERVVIQPGDGRGGKRREIQLHGALFEMLAFASSAAAKSSPSEKAQSRNAHSPRSAETGG